jgi:hypothetical protein
LLLTLSAFHVQVFRPLWPFFAASGITYYLVSKAQDIGVRCALFHMYQQTRQLTFTFFSLVFVYSRRLPQ